MKTAIEVCGLSSLAGLFLSAIGAMVAMIWDADFCVRLAATVFIVSLGVFTAAIVATTSPLYRD